MSTIDDPREGMRALRHMTGDRAGSDRTAAAGFSFIMGQSDPFVGLTLCRVCGWRYDDESPCSDCVDEGRA